MDNYVVRVLAGQEAWELPPGGVGKTELQVRGGSRVCSTTCEGAACFPLPKKLRSAQIKRASHLPRELLTHLPLPDVAAAVAAEWIDLSLPATPLLTQSEAFHVG